jgi:hypothetical protein
MVLGLLTLSGTALAADEAVFGLAWGQTPAQVQAQGIALTLEKTQGHLQVFSTRSPLPQGLKDASGYMLGFDDQKGLVKVRSLQIFVQDPDGSRGRATFDRLASVLASKYTRDPAHSMQVVGQRLYTKPDEFYQCLDYAGCGLWAQTFMAPTKRVMIQLDGLKPGTGSLSITVEAYPAFEQSLAKTQAEQAQAERNAL